MKLWHFLFEKLILRKDSKSTVLDLTAFALTCGYFSFNSKTPNWNLPNLQGDPKGSEQFFKNGCGIQMSQATPTKLSMLFKHNYDKLPWKFGHHSLNFSFVHGPSWLRALESIQRYGVIFSFWKKISKGHCEAMHDVKKIYFIDF